MIFTSFFLYVDLCNSRREGCDFQKNQQEDLMLRDATRSNGKEAAEGKAWKRSSGTSNATLIGPRRASSWSEF